MWGSAAAPRRRNELGDIHEQERLRAAYVREKAIQLYKEAGAETVLIGAPGGEGASTHAVGGARMGTDPATSLVDAYGVAHEVPNLVVMGGAVIPSRGAGAPTLTLQALAWRSAEHIVKNWRSIGRGSALRPAARRSTQNQPAAPTHADMEHQ